MKEKLHLAPDRDGHAWLLGEKRRRIPSHHHDELEINLVVGGTAHYLFERRRVAIAVGSLLWIFPRQEHVLFDWSHDFSMWVLVFRPRLVRRVTALPARRILRSADPGDIFVRRIDPRQLEALHQLYRDVAAATDAGFSRIGFEYALLRSWQAYQFSQESIPRTDVHPAVARAAKLLALADNHIPLDELARQAGLSPARLSRLFKRQVGMTLTAFQQQEGLKRFFSLYRTGARYSLIEAALAAGFGSYPQFHRIFRRATGRSPASYRKELAERSGE